MPVLTKEQVFEALVELDEEQRAEVIGRLRMEVSKARLSPELRAGVRGHRENSGAIESPRDEKS